MWVQCVLKTRAFWLKDYIIVVRDLGNLQSLLEARALIWVQCRLEVYKIWSLNLSLLEACCKVRSLDLCLLEAYCRVGSLDLTPLQACTMWSLNLGLLEAWRIGSLDLGLLKASRT